jgi:nucleoid DNA-binding protein
MAKAAKPAKSAKAITKSEIYAEVAASADISKAQVKAVFEALHELVVKQLSKKTAKIILPGLLRLTAKKTKAQKGGQTKPDPFNPGKTFITKDKPAGVKVKAFPVKALNEAVKTALA